MFCDLLGFLDHLLHVETLLLSGVSRRRWACGAQCSPEKTVRNACKGLCETCHSLQPRGPWSASHAQSCPIVFAPCWQWKNGTACMPSRILWLHVCTPSWGSSWFWQAFLFAPPSQTLNHHLGPQGAVLAPYSLQQQLKRHFWHLGLSPSSQGDAWWQWLEQGIPCYILKLVLSGNLNLICLVSLFSCRSIGGMYGMGGRTVRVPFLHSESFKPLGGDLRFVLMAYCQSGVSKIRRLKELLGWTHRISHNWSSGNFADCKILNP